MSRELIHGRHRTVIQKKNNCPVTQVVSTEKVLWVLDFNFFKSVSNVKVSWNVPTSRNTRLVFGNFSRPSVAHFITNIESLIREFPNLFCIFRLVDVFVVVDVRELFSTIGDTLHHKYRTFHSGKINLSVLTL